MGWKLEEILAATGGRIEREGTLTVLGEVITDSSKVSKGAVFVALKGERLDGHDFAAAAVRGGAACVIAHRALKKTAVRGATVVRVPDTLRALGDLAHHRREKLAPQVLAITGSNGKTTTKEMVAAILEEANIGGQRLRGKVLKTEGNFNNLVGLPLTLLRLRPEHKVAVVEAGTNQPGEIARLGEIADPDCAIITSVAAAHLEGLSSLAGVAREKGALYKKVRSGGTLAVNLDDARVRQLGARATQRKITYGARGQVRALDVRLRRGRGMQFALQAQQRRCRVQLNYLGRHNVTNALGAAALTLAAGVSLPAIQRGLAKARPFAMRMQTSSWRGVTIINDAYNANPASMKAALQTLAEIGMKGQRIAVLGDMFELGKKSRQEHLLLGKEIARSGIERVYLLGKEAAAVRRGGESAGMSAERITIGSDHGDIAEQLRARLKAGDALLVKGSRGMAMEKVLQSLQSQGLRG
ncbi:MAG: UDP-N-acetylmuramoyl-tripeptide--D-alanyl-D-alanine ligase [Deltaproteobacteria bacterium]|nr:UDP-N-acetylmuramoyl-tripeptide--D-alanyl-D-alanine ligase [Deltaproteobacteria bacterium]